MSVENGVVICYSNKSYEITSWNEQGEITRIEDMFIIDFLLFLSCSHRDKKTINLSMMIQYTINMPNNSDFPIRGAKRFDYSQREPKRNEELEEFIDGTVTRYYSGA